MTNVENRQIELAEIESSQRQHFNILKHQEEMYNVHTSMVYGCCRQLDCKVSKDGNQWCCLSGENLHDGIAGFGDTPHSAILKWGEEFGVK